MSNELGQAIINYLGGQPYGAVAGLIAGLQQMGEIDDKKLAEFMAVTPKAEVVPLIPEAKETKAPKGKGKGKGNK